MALTNLNPSDLLFGLLCWGKIFPIKRELLTSEIEQYSSEEVELLKSKKWLKGVGYSERYSCFDCSENCCQHVIKLEDGTLFVHCNQEGQPAKFIDAEELHCWRFDFEQFLADFKSALEIESETQISNDELSIGYYRACQLFIVKGSPLNLSFNKKATIPITNCLMYTDEGVKFDTAKISRLITQVTGVEESPFDRALRIMQRLQSLVEQGLTKTAAYEIIGKDEGVKANRIRKICDKAKNDPKIIEVLGLPKR